MIEGIIEIRATKLCGAIRPRDGVTSCNREVDHDYDHMELGPSVDGCRDAFATWSQDGVETCNDCGHRIDNSTGMCMAPLSVAD
jgi:hypothetical protein